jgi:hypothetical protein
VACEYQGEKREERSITLTCTIACRGCDDPQFAGDINEEVKRLRVLRLIDVLVVKKDTGPGGARSRTRLEDAHDLGIDTSAVSTC